MSVTTDRVDRVTRVFLETLEKCGNISQAAKASGLTRQTLYARREKNAAFAQAWDEAMTTAIDSLEAEAWRRARDGVPEYLVTGKGLVVDQNGEPIMQNRYSDTLLTTLLKAHRPERYKDRSSVDMNVTGSLAERLDEARLRVKKEKQE